MCTAVHGYFSIEYVKASIEWLCHSDIGVATYAKGPVTHMDVVVDDVAQPTLKLARIIYDSRILDFFETICLSPCKYNW